MEDDEVVEEKCGIVADADAVTVIGESIAVAESDE